MHDDKLKNISFYHKLRQGNVDATFYYYSEEQQFKIKEILPAWAELKKHGKTFSIRVFSGVIDRTKDFDSQINSVANGLQNIEKMRNWIVENESQWQ